MIALFRNHSYRRLFVAQILALIGTGLATVALGLLAYDLSGEHASEVLGTALALKMAAYVCVSPLVGALAERVPRRSLMVAADGVRAGVVLLLPFVDQVWQVFVLIAVLQTASAAFTPTYQAVLPDILPDEREYTAALSASQFAVSTESIVSPLLAAAALLVVDFHTLFVGTVFGFVGSALLVAGTAIPEARRGERDRFADRLVAGVRILTRTPRLRAVLALNMVVAGSGVITLVSTVNVVRDLLGGSDPDVALLLAVSGAGAAVAALAAPVLLRAGSERRVMLSGAAICVVAVAGAVALARAPSWPSACAIWFALGGGGALVIVPIGRVVRASAAATDRPAAFAAQFSLSHLCWLLTYPLTGWLASLAGFTVAWSTLLVLVTAAAATAVALWPRRLPTTIRHRHAESVEHAHLGGDARWTGDAWEHTHPFVIDIRHPRWPTPT